MGVVVNPKKKFCGRGVLPSYLDHLGDLVNAPLLLSCHVRFAPFGGPSHPRITIMIRGVHHMPGENIFDSTTMLDMCAAKAAMGTNVGIY